MQIVYHWSQWRASALPLMGLKRAECVFMGLTQMFLRANIQIYLVHFANNLFLNASE